MSLLISVIPRLPSTNLEVTKDFYTTILGFRKIGEEYPDYIMLKRDDIEIHFFHFAELNPLENYGMCYIRVSDVDILYHEFSTRKEGIKRPEVKPWRQKELNVLDPDHNALTFGQSI